jgi:hypothetical protein
MLIAIPSKARITRQITLGALPPDVRSEVWLAVPVEEEQAHRAFHKRVLVTPPGIGRTRQFLCDWAFKADSDGRLLMLDDDLTFAIRRNDDPTKFRTPTDNEIRHMLADIDMELDKHIHVAVAPREGGNRRTDNYVLNTRALRALAFDTEKLRSLGVRFDDAELMEDFTVQLRLLLLGHPHQTINWMVQNQAGSNLAGGCSTYRTMESQSKAAHALKERFPEFVNIVQKQTKTAWGGQAREDVIIQWKAAYAEGLRRAGKN